MGLTLKPHKPLHLFNSYTSETNEGKVTYFNDFKNKIILLSSATLFPWSSVSPSSWLYVPQEWDWPVVFPLVWALHLWVSAAMWLTFRKTDSWMKWKDCWACYEETWILVSILLLATVWHRAICIIFLSFFLLLLLFFFVSSFWAWVSSSLKWCKLQQTNSTDCINSKMPWHSLLAKISELLCVGYSLNKWEMASTSRLEATELLARPPRFLIIKKNTQKLMKEGHNYRFRKTSDIIWFHPSSYVSEEMASTKPLR